MEISVKHILQNAIGAMQTALAEAESPRDELHAAEEQFNIGYGQFMLLYPEPLWINWSGYQEYGGESIISRWSGLTDEELKMAVEFLRLYDLSKKELHRLREQQDKEEIEWASELRTDKVHILTVVDRDDPYDSPTVHVFSDLNVARWWAATYMSEMIGSTSQNPDSENPAEIKALEDEYYSMDEPKLIIDLWDNEKVIRRAEELLDENEEETDPDSLDEQTKTDLRAIGEHFKNLKDKGQ